MKDGERLHPIANALQKGELREFFRTVAQAEWKNKEEDEAVLTLRALLEAEAETLREEDWQAVARAVDALPKKAADKQILSLARDTLVRSLAARKAGAKPRKIGKFFEAPPPETVIAPRSGSGTFLARGEVAILTGAGGAGKSRLALQICAAAREADQAGGSSQHLETAGLRVYGAEPLYLSYEDELERVGPRVRNILELKEFQEGDDYPAGEGMRVRYMKSEPIYGVKPGGGEFDRPEKLETWHAMEQWALDGETGLLVIDPVSAAYVANANAISYVRAFMEDLRDFAKYANLAVLLVAHPTKSGRAESAPDRAGFVSGSAAWTDAARGVLAFRRFERKEKKRMKQEDWDDYVAQHPETEAPDDVLQLICEKANYCGRFEVYLQPDPDANVKGVPGFAVWQGSLAGDAHPEDAKDKRKGATARGILDNANNGQ